MSRTKHGADRLCEQLSDDGITTTTIHGNKSQNARQKALRDFKLGKVRALIATDVAARGLDIQHLPYVVNFELPESPEDYVHRIGRTGRAGNSGEAISLVCIDELQLFKGVERLLEQKVPVTVEPGYEPDPSIKAQPILRGRGGQRSRGQNRNFQDRNPRGRNFQDRSPQDRNARGRNQRSFSRDEQRGPRFSKRPV